MFRALLRLYPASFRHEYGREMQAVFARERGATQTPTGVALLWLRIIADTVVTAAAVHWDILIQDLRYSARTLLRTPAFTMTALAVVTLGIGATTAAFSIADFVLVRPLPFPESHRLVKVWERRPGFPRMELSPANYRDWKAMVTSFEGFAAYRGLSLNLVGASQPLRVDGAAMTADAFEALRVQPALGRAFTAADDVEGAPRTVLLSYGLWQGEFAGDPEMVGKTVRLDEQPYTIIGVMPREFTFPNFAARLWTPMRFQSAEFQDRNDNYLQVLARLRPGVTFDAAQAEMTIVATRLTQQYPKENEHTGASLMPLRDAVSRQTRTMLYALMGAAACVLLVACANLTNVLLARAITRRREMAVRMALGAGQERLLRQLLTESLLLTGIGGALGLALAAVAVPIFSRLVPSTLPVAQTPSLDGRVLIFAITVTVLTGVVFGFVPLLQTSRDRSAAGLREGARGGGSRHEGMRGALVVAEITASVVLLVVFGLLLRALWTMQAVDPGFNTERALTLRTSLPMPKYEEMSVRNAFYDRVLSDARALPGVSNAAYVSFLPLSDMRGGIFPVGTAGRPVADRREDNVAFLRYVTPGYFGTLGIPIRRGRDVRESDQQDGLMVAVVSETFGKRFFPGVDPIGSRFNFAGVEREIVGVVGEVKMRGLLRVSEPQVYIPHGQMTDPRFVWYAPKDMVVRGTVDPMSLVASVRAIVHHADPTVPLSEVQTLAQLVDGDAAPRITQLRVLGAFAGVALLLGGIGIQGLLAFAVSARAREIGVRMALGAQRSDVIGMIAKRSLTLTAIGIVLGVLLAYWAGRGLQSLLAGVSPGDVATFAVAIALALVMAIAGSLVPAVRVARVDPVTVMRLE